VLAGCFVKGRGPINITSARSYQCWKESNCKCKKAGKIDFVFPMMEVNLLYN